MDDVNAYLTTILPLGIVAIVFGLPIFAFVFFRVLAHRERMAMIAAGMPPGSVPRSPGNHKFDTAFPSEPARVTLNKGIRLAAIGTAMTIGLTIATVHTSEDGIAWHPGPWLLLGLVPMFIGIAQIIIGLLSGSQFAAAPAPAGAPFTPPPSPEPFVPPPATATSYRSEFHPPATPDP